MGPFLDFADKEMETAIQQHRNGMPTRFRFVFNFCAFGMLLFGLLYTFNMKHTKFGFGGKSLSLRRRVLVYVLHTRLHRLRLLGGV